MTPAQALLTVRVHSEFPSTGAAASAHRMAGRNGESTCLMTPANGTVAPPARALPGSGPCPPRTPLRYHVRLVNRACSHLIPQMEHFGGAARGNGDPQMRR
jgi:hypothetical protein